MVCHCGYMSHFINHSSHHVKHLPVEEESVLNKIKFYCLSEEVLDRFYVDCMSHSINHTSHPVSNIRISLLHLSSPFLFLKSKSSTHLLGVMYVCHHISVENLANGHAGAQIPVTSGSNFPNLQGVDNFAGMPEQLPWSDFQEFPPPACHRLTH